MKICTKTALLIVAAAVAGCAADKPAPRAPQEPQVGFLPLQPVQEEAVADAQRQTHGGLVLEDEILRLCPAVKPPKFEYDSSRVNSEFRAALVELAKCLTEGKLTGKNLLLVGHADPRGEEDYNMALGGRRADSVRSALTSLGVAKERLDVSSRGELEAKGTDDGSWANDRRVDVKIGPSKVAKEQPAKSAKSNVDMPAAPDKSVARAQ